MSDEKVQHFQDHHDIHILMLKALDHAEHLEGGARLCEVLEQMIEMEEAHMRRTYTLLSGTKEAFFAQHGVKLAGAFVPLFVAILSHWTMLLTDADKEVLKEAASHQTAAPTSIIIEVQEPSSGEE